MLEEYKHPETKPRIDPVCTSKGQGWGKLLFIKYHKICAIVLKRNAYFCKFVQTISVKIPKILGEHSHITDVTCFWGIFDLPTYSSVPNRRAGGKILKKN